MCRHLCSTGAPNTVSCLVPIPLALSATNRNDLFTPSIQTIPPILIMRFTAFLFLTALSTAAAFAPSSTSSGVSSSTTTQLHAESSRREVMGAIGAALGAGMLLSFPESSAAFSNPALQTLKSRKPTKQAFIPGKGLHDSEDYETLMAANNPALQTLRSRKPTKQAFIPGKGLRNTEEYENLLAANNPALQTLRSRKPTKQAFIPGKGLRNTEDNDFDMLVAGLQNPASQTFKGRKHTKQAFIPGKGLRLTDSFDELLG